MIKVEVLDEVEELEVTGGDLVVTEGDLVVTEGDIELVHVDKKLVLPSKNDAAKPTLAFGDGDTGFYEYSDDYLILSIGGVAKWDISSNHFEAVGTNKIAMMDATPTATVPGVSFGSDYNTGMGRAAADALSLIAGGVEGHRITEAAGAITHVLTDNVGITGNLDVDGNLNTDGILTTPSTETKTNGSAIGITTAITLLDASATEYAYVLPDGVEGQEKYILQSVFGMSNMVITPTNLWGGTTITLAGNTYQTAHLVFINGKWAFMGGTGTIA